MKKFAVFDIDGTLIRWQLYHAVVDRLAKKNLLGEDAHQKLHDARMKWKQREHPDAFAEYELALIDIYEAALGHLQPEQFDQATQEVVAEYGNQVYVYTRNLVDRLKAEGYILLAISGSHQELIEHIAQQYGFDDCIGSRYSRNQTGFSGERYIASHDKKSALEQLVAKHNLTFDDSYAIGDSLSDAAMLEMVSHPIAFNPDRRLFHAAKANGWTIVIERKNVIYKLEQHHGRYQLAPAD